MPPMLAFCASGQRISLLNPVHDNVYDAASPSTSPSPSSPVTPTSPTSSKASTTPRAKKRHQCPTCTKCFSTSGHLTRHSRTHTGEKSHSCPYPACVKRCSRHDNLVQHYRIHLPKAERGNTSAYVRAALQDMRIGRNVRIAAVQRPKPSFQTSLVEYDSESDDEGDDPDGTEFGSLSPPPPSHNLARPMTIHIPPPSNPLDQESEGSSRSGSTSPVSPFVDSPAMSPRWAPSTSSHPSAAPQIGSSYPYHHHATRASTLPLANSSSFRSAAEPGGWRRSFEESSVRMDVS